MFKLFKQFTKFEMGLWLLSLIIITTAFIISPIKYYLSLFASLIGVTALIFVAKGLFMGQILTIVFAILYGIISLKFKYYGEMITYLAMTSPMALLAAIEWMKHPYKDSNVVKIKKISKIQLFYMAILGIIVTTIFYFILKALNTTNLIFSTISVTTSFVAAYLTFLRSPYYAFGYAANDIILIVLWILATIKDISYIPMVVCFIMFFVNDVYGFINWKRMHKKQKS